MPKKNMTAVHDPSLQYRLINVVKYFFNRVDVESAFFRSVKKSDSEKTGSRDKDKGSRCEVQGSRWKVKRATWGVLFP